MGILRERSLYSETREVTINWGDGDKKNGPMIVGLRFCGYWRVVSKEGTEMKA
jgi:hypothetical protein